MWSQRGWRNWSSFEKLESVLQRWLANQKFTIQRPPFIPTSNGIILLLYELISDSTGTIMDFDAGPFGHN